MANQLTPLQNALLRISPAEFERLVLALLGDLTGLRFYQASAGRQDGRDGATAHGDIAAIHAEAKRYEPDTSLNKRELLGELVESRLSRPDLDLWVCAATRGVPDLTVQALKQYGDEQGFVVEILDWQLDVLPELGVLCAAFAKRTVDFLEQHAGVARNDMEQVLHAISTDSDFPKLLESLKTRFSAPSIGLDAACRKMGEWLEEKISSSRESRAHLGQRIVLHGEEAQHYIRRETVHQSLQKWQANWGSQSIPFALLGAEGMGKSWAALDWWRQLRTRDEFPLTLIFTRHHGITDAPMEMIASALHQRLGVSSPEVWKHRIKRWLQRPAESGPVLLLIFDGLNEQPHAPWMKLLQTLQSDPWHGRVQVLLTCRPQYWEQMGKLHGLSFPPDSCEVAPFSDQELDQILHLHSRNRSEFSSEIQGLLRKPRLFRLAMRHYEVLETSGDLTVHRLLFEDAHARWNERGLPHMEQDFTKFLLKLAKKTKKKIKTFTKKNIEELLPKDSQVDPKEHIRTLGEILDGDLFDRSEYDPDQFKVKANLTEYALGMWLAGEVRKVGEKDLETVEQYLAEFLDQLDGIPEVNTVRRAAAGIAMLTNPFPHWGRVGLLLVWIGGHNLTDDDQRDFPAYLPLDPEAYLDTAEIVWSVKNYNNSSTGTVAYALLKWNQHAHVNERLVQRMPRWMGTICRSGFPEQKMWRLQREEDISPRIRDALGENAVGELAVVAGFSLPATDEHRFLRLNVPGIMLLSFLPRKTFLPAIRDWALSRAVMGVPEEVASLAWMLRLNTCDPNEAELALEELILSLIQEGSISAAWAVRYLCNAWGSPKAMELKTKLPTSIRDMRQPFWEEAQAAQGANPCEPFLRVSPFSREVVENCLAREDADIWRQVHDFHAWMIDPYLNVPDLFKSKLEAMPLPEPVSLWTSMGTTREDLNFQEFEPVGARVALPKLIEHVRSVFRTAPSRSRFPLRQLSWQITRYLPLLGEQEKTALMDAWESLLASDDPSGDRKYIENRLFLVVLEQMPPCEQWRRLVNRSKEFIDWLSLETAFGLLNQEEVEALIHTLDPTESSVHSIRKLWFLSRQKVDWNDALRERILAFLDHSDHLVQNVVLRAIFDLNDSVLGSQVVDRGWRWQPDYQKEVNRWGSHCLRRFGHGLTYAELRERVDPLYLEWVLTDHAFPPEEMAQWMQDLDALLVPITGSLPLDDPLPFSMEVTHPDPPGPGKFCSWDCQPAGYPFEVVFTSKGVPTPGERSATDMFQAQMDGEKLAKQAWERHKETAEQQLRGGNRLFRAYEAFLSPALDRLVELQPAWALRWSERILAAPELQQRKWLAAGMNFFPALCQGLLKADPEAGARLWSALSPLGGISLRHGSPSVDWWLLMLFQVGESKAVAGLREEQIDPKQASTDAQLFEVILAVEQSGRGNLVEQWIEADMASGTLWRQARGITLASLSDNLNLFLSVRSRMEGVQGWLADVFTRTQTYWERHRRAGYWLEEFLRQRDEVEAWAAFTLLRHCADRRIYLTLKKRLDSTGDISEQSRTYLYHNHQDLESQTKKNEEKMKERLYGTDVKRKQVWPWLG